ncbi:hypothetical protein GCM10022226_63880 [Sphaerisporangium flaviroseum]|uniref:Uncharacterized protein n=1 Tax=Sphaerisporangium flaviroseum TaxID=509199 RepID=A0ABP7J456_9ACTN
MGLKFAGLRRFDAVSIRTFERLERRLGAADAGLADVVTELVARIPQARASCEGLLAGTPGIREAVAKSLHSRSRTLLAGR